MGHPVGVYTTVGEDPGLTPDERRERARVAKWEKVLAGSQERLARLILIAADPSTDASKAARLKVQCDRASEEIERAKVELAHVPDYPTN